MKYHRQQSPLSEGQGCATCWRSQRNYKKSFFSQKARSIKNVWSLYFRMIIPYSLFISGIMFLLNKYTLF